MKLKNINLGLGLMALLALSSCADDKFSEYRTDMTKSLKEYQYLNNYEPLKKYVEDMKAAGKCNPNFKLGIALEAAEFNKQALVYCLAGSNFNEMTAGNAMKMASCVKDDGSMDFSLVKEFVKNAKDADMTIYGHTLAWHSQAANKYLKNLISDENLIENGDFAKESARGWNPTGCTIKVASAAAAVEVEQLVHEQTYKDGPFPFYAMGCEPPVVNGAIHFVPTGDWSQFFVMPSSNNTLSEEGNYVVYLDLSASKDASGVELTMQNGWDANSNQQITVKVPVSAGRHTVKLPMPNIAGGNYDIILKPQTADATLDVHSVKVYQVKNLNSIPLTDEEKKNVLTTAMGTWIDGMMEATDGYVTSWDVVNEALSGADKDGDGKFDLQSAKRGNVSADDAKNNFYWQDYLGDIDYVRTAVAAARKSFAAHNGDPEKLKLFINDYNLESDWDDNGKLRSLIQWIKDWEADGVTKIDGIASQMHISCYADPVKQESVKNHIVKMLELMKKSEKLCKISELDMGYVDAAGKDVTYDQMTEEQHKEMRDLYTFVLQKYFEIIPIDKQYGITQWCATDSPKDSGWRPGLATGLWDLNYLRKHTYAGFAVGLGAPKYWENLAE